MTTTVQVSCLASGRLFSNKSSKNKGMNFQIALYPSVYTLQVQFSVSCLCRDLAKFLPFSCSPVKSAFVIASAESLPFTPDIAVFVGLVSRESRYRKSFRVALP